MAQSSSNLASIYYIVCFLLLVFASGKEYCIVPSQSAHCLTLSQFVSAFTNCSNCNNTTLLFAPGGYNLESNLIVEDVHSFSMFAEHFLISPWIVCSPNATFEFRNIGTVTINGLDFIECSGNLFESVTRFRLTKLTFYDHPEVDGTTLTIAESIAYVDRVAFLSTIESALDRTNTSLQLQENCTSDSVTVYRILTSNSVVIISQSSFDTSVIGVGAVISSLDRSEITIFNSTFKNNRATCCSAVICIGAIVSASQSIMAIYDSKFEYNRGIIATTCGGIASFTDCVFYNHFRLYEDLNIESVVSVRDSNLTINYSTFINNTVTILQASYCNISISISKFIGNNQCLKIKDGQMNIDHSVFVSNSGLHLIVLDAIMINIHHNEFVNNTMLNLIGFLNAKRATVKFNEFIGNKVDFALIGTVYYTPPGGIINNVFIDNSAAYDIFIHLDCEPGLSLSLGSSRCIKCPERWYLNFVGLIIAAFVAGIVLVILMLALNFTVAVGTLSGIFFYANIVASNMDAYLPLSSTPNLVSVFISWLNLNTGLDICFFEGMTAERKSAAQLAFPTYVISLVIIIIIISEYSTKFAKVVGKGDPVAVLATMILVSYTKCFKAIIGSVSLLYLQPAYGSSNFDPTNFITYAKSAVSVTDIGKALFAISPIVFLLGLFYTALVFSWQWLVQCQDKKIFKWVRYQKLQHFMQPYHAPYTTKYRYWTGLLLVVRIILFSISNINFTRDPRVDYVSTIFVVGCLVLMKGVVAKRIYKNVLLDVMETAIYFNLVIFATFSWYSLDFGGNQVAVAYISVMIIFALLLVVIVFHVLRFTSLNKLSFRQKFFQWITTKLTKEKPTQEEVVENEPDEIDGVLQRRARPPYVSYSIVEMSQNEP